MRAACSRSGNDFALKRGRKPLEYWENQYEFSEKTYVGLEMGEQSGGPAA